MLYDLWRRVVREHGSELALRDLASGRHWTFAALARDVEVAPRPGVPVVYPQGHSADFILNVLRAWRWEVSVCPLEPNQAHPEVPLPPEPCVHLKTTSATTGAPRGVAFTAAQLAADADQIVATMGLRPEWPNLAVISMAHSYGFSNLVLPLALHGIPLLIAPSPLPEPVRQVAQTAAVVTLPAVPALWRAWHEAGSIPGNVRLAISAGAPLLVGLEQQVFAQSGLKIHNFYGSSECGGIAFDSSEIPRSDDACVGLPMRNVDLSVTDEGCLEVQSNAVAETYWPHPLPSLGRGRFLTTDLAELKDGVVYLRGRVGDQINVAGRKVSPEVIERVLIGHEAVSGCLVFGVPAPGGERGDTVVACIAAQYPTTQEALRQFLLARLPAWQVPREWWFVDSLGPNLRGKVSRADWRRRYLQTQPRR